MENGTAAPPTSPVKTEEEEFIFFNNIKNSEFDEVTSKCFVFSLVDELLRLKMLQLDDWLIKRLQFVCEPEWKEKYTRVA